MTGKKLLLVEDDPKSLFAIRALLEAHGFDVLACGSAEDAIARMDGEGDLSCAVIDLRLPRMQGPELGHALRQRHPAIQLIFTTAFDGSVRAREEFPDAHVLVKPLDVQALLKHIDGEENT